MLAAPGAGNPAGGWLPGADSREPVTVTVIATTAAVIGIIAAGYALSEWATDNHCKSAVGQVCNPPDGNPNNAWSTEDHGWDWASTGMALPDWATDPCGFSANNSWANAVWGEETSNDVWTSSVATPDASSSPSTPNHVNSAGRAQADNYEVVTPPPPRAGDEPDTLRFVRTVEIDSLVMTSSIEPTVNDTAYAAWVTTFAYDGVVDTAFSAAILWTDGDFVVTGDLSAGDLDEVGYSPGEGFVVKMFDFVRSDTTTFIAGAGFRDAPPESVETHTAVEVAAAASAPGPWALWMNHDGTFENGYCWGGTGVLPPFFGAFGEAYDLGPARVAGAALWLTQMGNYIGQPADLYIWEGGVSRQPGQVIHQLPAVQLGQVPLFPEVRRVDLLFPVPVDVQGEFTIGFWAGYQAQACPVYVAADTQGHLRTGYPWTNIAPGLPYPMGWQHPSVVWGPTNSLGIGVWIMEEEQGTPEWIAPPDMTARLQPCAPNPLRGETTVRFSLGSRQPVTLGIFDLAGRLRRTLASGTLAAGGHDVAWDGRDDAGRAVGSGVYFARLGTGTLIQSAPVTILR